MLLAEKYSKALHSDIKVVGVDLSGDPHVCVKNIIITILFCSLYSAVLFSFACNIIGW